MTEPIHAYGKMALQEVTDALWSDEARVKLSARQVGRVVDILRVSEGHTLHRRARANCPICKSHDGLKKATKDANGL